MSKPKLFDVLTLVVKKERAAQLYKEIDEAVAKMVHEFGPGRFDYDLEQFMDEWNPDNDYPFDESLMDGGRYLKFEIVDNVENLRRGEDVWKSVGFKPVTFSFRNLKRCPEALK